MTDEEIRRDNFDLWNRIRNSIINIKNVKNFEEINPICDSIVKCAAVYYGDKSA